MPLNCELAVICYLFLFFLILCLVSFFFFHLRFSKHSRVNFSFCFYAQHDGITFNMLLINMLHITLVLVGSWNVLLCYNPFHFMLRIERTKQCTMRTDKLLMTLYIERGWSLCFRIQTTPDEKVCTAQV